jgi:glutamate racemase
MLVPISVSLGSDSVRVSISRLAERDSITVLVTDSGLGGLSVCADVESRGRQTGIYRKLRIVFANALPEANRGYNRMKSTAEKVQVFDSALQGMARWYEPDVILVACNTLSVLIPETRFVAVGSVPVLGIVETGVEMLFERLMAKTGATAIIFGTETTIGAETHRRLLIEMGIDSSRLVNQACPNLAGEIETDARSDIVQSAIDMFVADALEKTTRKPDIVLAGLCCTHYGYTAPEFVRALNEQGVRQAVVVDPNARMSDVLFPEKTPRRSEEPEILVEVVSRAVITPGEVSSISGLVSPVSPATARALEAYSLKRDLFSYSPAEK